MFYSNYICVNRIMLIKLISFVGANLFMYKGLFKVQYGLNKYWSILCVSTNSNYYLLFWLCFNMAVNSLKKIKCDLWNKRQKFWPGLTFKKKIYSQNLNHRQNTKFIS